MPTALTHTAVALALGRLASPSRERLRFWGWAVALSVLPDLDSLGFAFGVRYEDVIGHRGFFHSLGFAALCGVVVAFLAFRESDEHRWRLAGFFFLVTASHGVLDALTNGGLGIAFFSPFHLGRWFLPWTPLEVAPLGLGRFLGPRGLEVLRSELVVVWLPLGAVLAFVEAVRRFRAKRRNRALG